MIAQSGKSSQVMMTTFCDSGSGCKPTDSNFCCQESQVCFWIKRAFRLKGSGNWKLIFRKNEVSVLT
jgi:hypothetical protein